MKQVFIASGGLVQWTLSKGLKLAQGIKELFAYFNRQASNKKFSDKNPEHIRTRKPKFDKDNSLLIRKLAILNTFGAQAPIREQLTVARMEARAKLRIKP